MSDGVVSILRFRGTSNIAPLTASLKVTYPLPFSQALPSPESRELENEYEDITPNYRFERLCPGHGLPSSSGRGFAHAPVKPEGSSGLP